MPKYLISFLKRRSGFTLIELMVVVLIIGVLVAFAIPQYVKSMEASKADDAAAIVKMIGTANRMFYLDRGKYTTGQLNNFPLSPDCGAAACDTSRSEGCQLIACKYLANLDWASKPYDFFAANVSENPNFVASATRCTVNSDNRKGCTQSAPYKGYGYTIDANGKMLSAGGAPKPPA